MYVAQIHGQSAGRGTEARRAADVGLGILLSRSSAARRVVIIKRLRHRPNSTLGPWRGGGHRVIRSDLRHLVNRSTGRSVDVGGRPARAASREARAMRREFCTSAIFASLSVRTVGLSFPSLTLHPTPCSLPAPYPPR